MDASALDNAISTLEGPISGIEKYVQSLEVWLWIASAAVVIGVVAEMYFILDEPPQLDSALAMQGRFEQSKACFDAERGLIKALTDNGLPDVSLQAMRLTGIPLNSVVVRVGPANATAPAK